MRVASTAVSIVPWPDIITTGIVSWPLAAHSLSSVMPSVSGIQMSSSTRSGRPRSRKRRASPALSASSTWCPSSARISESSSRMPTSSSTTRICAIALRGLGERQQHADRCAAARMVVDRDAAVMLVDNFLHDGQAEAAAALLGGDIGFEDARHQLLWKAAAIVRHREPDLLADQLGTHLDHGARLAPRTVLERILRVLDEIVDHLPDLRAIGPYRRQAGRELPLDRHARILVERQHVAHQRIEI